MVSTNLKYCILEQLTFFYRLSVCIVLKICIAIAATTGEVRAYVNCTQKTLLCCKYKHTCILTKSVNSFGWTYECP